MDKTENLLVLLLQLAKWKSQHVDKHSKSCLTKMGQFA